MEWTDEVIERLKSLWAEGHSTAEIGRRLGTTKNAVVGKAHRLKLPTRPSPIKSRTKKQGDGSKSSQNELFGKEAEKSTVSAAKISKTKEVSNPELSESKKSVSKTASPVKETVKPVLKPVSPAPETLTPPPQKEAVKLFEKKETGAVSAKKTAAKPAPQIEDLDDFDEILEKDFAAEAERLKAKRKSRTPEKREKLIPQVPKRLGLTCQWPFGDPGDADFHFCGEKIVPGRPYCPQHCEQAYVRKIVK